MKSVLDAVAVFFQYALLAIFAESVVFSRSLGISRLIQLSGTGVPEKHRQMFGGLFCLTQVMSAPLCYFAGQLLLVAPNRAPYRPLVYLTVISLVCGLEALVIRSVWHKEEVVRLIPMAGLNSGVMGTILVERTQSFGMWQSVAFGLGSGLGYMLAVMLVSEAQERLRSKCIPEAFRGMPITLIYIGVLALAIYGFTGHTVIL